MSIITFHFVLILGTMTVGHAQEVVETTTLDLATANNFTTKKLLSRHKRYLAFPEGSSVSAAICMTCGVIGNPNVDWLSWAVNWGVSYDLPNYSWVRQHVNGFGNKTKAEAQRRSRRSFYEQVQLAIENVGFNGYACIARAICESAKLLNVPTGKRRHRGNMIEEIVRIVFKFPTAPVSADESYEHHDYYHIYQRARREFLDCSTAYPDCHFSLLELALGKYSVTPAQHSSYVFM